MHYSWLPRGVSSSIINTLIQGRCSLIAAWLSSGEFLGIIVSDTENSKKFWQFMHILKYALKVLQYFNLEKWIITLDNASITQQREH